MWAQLINTGLGLWLMVVPAVLNYNKIGTDNCHITGPLIVSFAFVACWEVTRPLPKINWLTEAWLLAAPWILGYDETLPIVNDMLVARRCWDFLL